MMTLIRRHRVGIGVGVGGDGRWVGVWWGGSILQKNFSFI
jgi:hypothetical protein